MPSHLAERVPRPFRLLQREILRDAMLGAAQCDAWLTLRELARLTGYGEASISAQLRHLRKPHYGGFAVEKRHREAEEVTRTPRPGAVWEYQLRRSVRAASVGIRLKGAKRRKARAPQQLTRH
jgi:hypothetical protein